jgi:hypothetical protein
MWPKKKRIVAIHQHLINMLGFLPFFVNFSVFFLRKLVEIPTFYQKKRSHSVDVNYQFICNKTVPKKAWNCKLSKMTFNALQKMHKLDYNHIEE